jgi:hypothetical protein
MCTDRERRRCENSRMGEGTVRGGWTVGWIINGLALAFCGCWVGEAGKSRKRNCQARAENGIGLPCLSVF